MFQAFVIVLREGFEAFLIVAVILSYLKKMRRDTLLPAVYWGIGISLGLSALLGFVMSHGVNEPLWEGVLGFFAAVMVTTLVIHMWREGAKMKTHMEERLGSLSVVPSTAGAWWGVFAFTVLMITREGMETALMLIQVPQSEIFAGAALGALATAAFAFCWTKFSSLINLKLFFQVTGVFLLLFVVQILIYTAHEFSEAGIIPNSEAFHNATEPFAPDGLYGKWFSVFTIAICGAWLVLAWVKDSLQKAQKTH